jgi:aspartate-semialdehyde dehydrogenase
MQAGSGGIIANPNCSTIIALMAVTPIHRAKTVKRMVVSTYQAASGAGQAAMDELEAQTRAVLEGKDIPMEIFPFQYAFNLFSHNAPMQENGYNEEVPLRALFCMPISLTNCPFAPCMRLFQSL